LRNDNPTSELLAQLVRDAPGDAVTLGWIAEQLRGRSFGLLTLVMAVVGLTPGIASVSGFLLAIPAIQLLLGRETFTLPQSLARRSIQTARFARLIRRTVPVLRMAETFARPRLWPSQRIAGRVVGGIELLLAIAIIFPFPFAYILPTLAIIVIALAYLEEDGFLLWLGFAVAFVALCFIGALTWIALRAAGAITGL
jgi:hypothetical protein